MRMMSIVWILAILAVTTAGRPVQDIPAGMARYQVVFLKPGQNWQATANEARAKLMGEHLAYFRSLVAAGNLVAVGPTTGDDVKGILIFRGSAEEATALASEDPAVKAGAFVPEVHPWLGTDGIGAGYPERAKAKPIEELPMESLQFVTLTRGPSWTPAKTPEVEKLQAAHMEHIGAMAKSRNLVAAGPFLDGGSLRGIFIFRCSAETAKALAMDDPMVKAGRLQLAFYTWSPNTNVIPAAQVE